MNKLVLFIILILNCLKINGQTKSETKLGSWYMYYGNHILTNNWSLKTGFEERNYQTFQNYNLTLYLLGANYKIKKNLTATLSYLYLDIDRTFDPDVVPNTKENRFYEQLNYNTKYFNIPISHRFRVEHRFLNSMGIKTNLNRARYRIKAKIAISKLLYLTGSNESFFNFKGKLYPENRFMTTVGFRLTKKISIETGYLGHYINDLHLNRFLIGFYLKTDFRKKAKN